MKQPFRFIVFLLFLFSSLLAAEKHPVWQVKGKHNSLFLVGSFHMLTQDQYPLPSVFDSVYAQSAVLVFEADLDSLSSPTVAVQLIQKGMLPGQQTVKDVLSDSVFKKLTKTLQNFGQPIELYLKMKPWLLTITLSQMNMAKMHFDPKLGIEFYYAKKAKQDGKPTRGLESVAFQLSLLEKLSQVNPDKLVLQSLLSIEQSQKALHQLVQAWKTGDAMAIDSLINASLKEFPQIAEFLLKQRNLTWLKKILPLLMEQKNVLIVVGVGHLVGPDGLIELLRKMGYAVKQL